MYRRDSLVVNSLGAERNLMSPFVMYQQKDTRPLSCEIHGYATFR
jgi:hypothetical protein